MSTRTIHVTIVLEEIPSAEGRIYEAPVEISSTGMLNGTPIRDNRNFWTFQVGEMRGYDHPHNQITLVIGEGV